MTIELSTDLIQRIQLHIQSGTGNSPEEVMRKALDVLDSQSSEAADLVAIEASLNDFDRGERGRSALEALSEIRSQLGIKSTQ